MSDTLAAAADARQRLTDLFRRIHAAEPSEPPVNQAEVAAMLKRIDREDAEPDQVTEALGKIQHTLERLAPPPLRRLAMSPKEKSTYIRGHGIEAYRQLPK